MTEFKLLPKDLLIKIVIELELPDILELSISNKYFNRIICYNNIFWINKFYHEYNNKTYGKPCNKSWKEFYKYITVIEHVDLLWKGIDDNVISYVVVALKRCSDINICCGKRIRLNPIRIPISEASKNGHLEILKCLIEKGFDINDMEDFALRIASRDGHLDVVKYLVEHGANIHAKHDESLLWAKINKHEKISEYLMEQGSYIHHDDRYFSDNDLFGERI